MSDELPRPVVIACRSLRPELEILRPEDGSIEIIYLEKILFGPYSVGDFITLEPGEVVSQKLFF
jgi:hypothetical protein